MFINKYSWINTNIWFVIFSFLVSNLPISQVNAQIAPIMPKPGVRVSVSPAFAPSVVSGMVIHPENALRFDFLVNPGDQQLTDSQKQEEYMKLVKYFMASLTVPDDDQWVNLSPYEKNRIVNPNFGNTQMGRDLLTQDYLLKQITSSMMYPEDELGQSFWKKVYQKAKSIHGVTDIPVSTFNKVWIVPEKAEVLEKGNTVMIVDSRLKVMLEEDYLALDKNSLKNVVKSTTKDDSTSRITSQVVKEIILPELEKEVNTGKNFALLRQIYSAMILATWFKQTLKESLVGKVYSDQSKLAGVDLNDPGVNNKIYQQYLQAYKKGAFNYIKEEVDALSGQRLPKKYFSGGFSKAMVVTKVASTPANTAMIGSQFLKMLLVAVSLVGASSDIKGSIPSSPAVTNNVRSTLKGEFIGERYISAVQIDGSRFSWMIFNGRGTWFKGFEIKGQFQGVSLNDEQEKKLSPEIIKDMIENLAKKPRVPGTLGGKLGKNGFYVSAIQPSGIVYVSGYALVEDKVQRKWWMQQMINNTEKQPRAYLVNGEIVDLLIPQNIMEEAKRLFQDDGRGSNQAGKAMVSSADMAQLSPQFWQQNSSNAAMVINNKKDVFYYDINYANKNGFEVNVLNYQEDNSSLEIRTMGIKGQRFKFFNGVTGVFLHGMGYGLLIARKENGKIIVENYSQDGQLTRVDLNDPDVQASGYRLGFRQIKPITPKALGRTIPDVEKGLKNILPTSISAKINKLAAKIDASLNSSSAILHYGLANEENIMVVYKDQKGLRYVLKMGIDGGEIEEVIPLDQVFGGQVFVNRVDGLPWRVNYNGVLVLNDEFIKQMIQSAATEFGGIQSPTVLGRRVMFQNKDNQWVDRTLPNNIGQIYVHEGDIYSQADILIKYFNEDAGEYRVWSLLQGQDVNLIEERYSLIRKEIDGSEDFALVSVVTDENERLIEGVNQVNRAGFQVQLIRSELGKAQLEVTFGDKKIDVSDVVGVIAQDGELIVSREDQTGLVIEAYRANGEVREVDTNDFGIQLQGHSLGFSNKKSLKLNDNSTKAIDILSDAFIKEFIIKFGLKNLLFRSGANFIDKKTLIFEIYGSDSRIIRLPDNIVHIFAKSKNNDQPADILIQYFDESKGTYRVMSILKGKDVDPAMLELGDKDNREEVGGIDLNAANLDLYIKRDGKGVPLPLPQQDWQQLQNIPGFIPVILEIKPAAGTPILSDLQSGTTPALISS